MTETLQWFVSVAETVQCTLTVSVGSSQNHFDYFVSAAVVRYLCISMPLTLRPSVLDVGSLPCAAALLLAVQR